VFLVTFPLKSTSRLAFVTGSVCVCVCVCLLRGANSVFKRMLHDFCVQVPNIKSKLRCGRDAQLTTSVRIADL
jgi:hypothetical protein